MADAEPLARAQKIVTERLGLKVLELEPQGRIYNNYTYRLTLDTRDGPQSLQSNGQYGTTAFPPETKSLILRIPNLDASLNHESRIEHEIAALELVRTFGSPLLRSLIPDVYSWARVDQADGDGWILYESKDGINIGLDFPRLPYERQKVILSQLAYITKAFHELPIPDAIDRYGGLRFSDNGDVASGPAALPIGDPVETYEDVYRNLLRRQLELSDSSDLIAGWKSSNLRHRLDEFASEGIDAIFRRTPIPDKRTFVHGDLSAQNILVDPDTFQITGLLDFEFSQIASPLEEYLYSFHDVHGLIPGAHTTDEGLLSLRDSLLHGFPSPLPESPPLPTGPVRFGSKRNIQWHLAKAWDDELAKAGVERPATIPYADEVSRIHWFAQEICPFYFLQSMWLEAVGEERAQQERSKQHGLLDEYLKGWGY
ncbi:kinase-like domain-containing protein [Aspergillus ambiguus]|uniref:phosphotransferase family protein n=1 Tax=Aspergillus ambiguus TaxID=176160 RepID=UPI003CCD0802